MEIEPQEVIAFFKWLIGLFAAGIIGLFGLLAWLVRRQTTSFEVVAESTKVLAQSTKAVEKNTEALTALAVSNGDGLREFRKQYDNPEHFSTVGTNKGLGYAADIAKHFAEKNQDEKVIALADQMKRSVSE